MSFLPTSAEEIRKLGWDVPDIIIVSGDAYVDHPAFAAAIIGRYLQAAGFKVAILDQPDWQDESAFLALGRPRLFFGVTAGNMDSMVNHYTAQKKLRHNDAYTANGIHGKRPDRATIVYTNLIRRAFKNIPVIIGGVEASLRRIAHYDYWTDKVRNSILSDSKADVLVYGMGEKPILQIAKAMNQGIGIKELSDIPSTVVFTNDIPADAIVLPDASDCADKNKFWQMTKIFEENQRQRVMFQRSGGRILKHNPPMPPLEANEMDSIYSLAFEYLPHPKYKEQTIPAFEQIKTSITSHRGCYGACNFCSIGLHQGRAIQSRSEASIINEAQKLAASKGFGGTISDIGGPTANMYGTSCNLGFPVSCKRRSCLFPNVCEHLNTDHTAHIKLIKKIKSLQRIRNVFIASGIRHDLAASQKEYIGLLASEFTGGRLKLAPEHVIKRVLALMGKPDIRSYETFCKDFHSIAKQKGLNRQIVPYIIIGHPGTSLKDAIALGKWLEQNNIRLEQVQEFTPTPMSISTCMYYTGMDYESGKAIEVPKGHQIRLQKALVFWYDKAYAGLIAEANRLAKS